MTNTYEELYHHGIKGMKWGVRRFQDKNGRLTSAGKRRYDQSGVDSGVRKNTSEKKKNYDELAKKTYELFPETEQEKTPYFKKKLQEHKDKLYSEYKSYGCSDKVARQRVDEQIRKERNIAILAGALAVGVAGVATYNYIQRSKTLNKGKAFMEDSLLDLSATPLHRIAADNDLTKGHAFYAAFEEMDRKKYIGGYGNQLKMQADNIYDLTINTKSKVNLAGKNKAMDTFFELLDNNPEFKKECLERNESWQANPMWLMLGDLKSVLTFNRFDKSIGSGSYRNLSRRQKEKLYDTFNRQLVDHDTSKIQNIFYSKLKEQGYHALEDVNDQKYSGYRAQHPLIVFDDSVVSNVSARELSDSELMLRGLWFNAKVMLHG